MIKVKNHDSYFIKDTQSEKEPAGHFIYVISLNLHDNPGHTCGYHSHFTDTQTESQTGKATCQGSQS